MMQLVQVLILYDRATFSYINAFILLQMAILTDSADIFADKSGESL